MRYFPFILLLFFVGCRSKQKIDLLVYNAHVYTIDSAFSTTEAIAIKDGKIVAVGKWNLLQEQFTAKESFDAGGNFIYPGFIDAHCHFFGYGRGLQECNLVGTKSWNEVLDRLKVFVTTHTTGWLVGRGWDQNDWADKRFPTNDLLNELFPNRPVLLGRVDGHAAIANKAALQLAGLQPNQKLVGGEIITQNGKLTGVLVDNAVKLVQSKIPTPGAGETTQFLLEAQQNCFAAGLTSVQDCGLDAAYHLA